MTPFTPGRDNRGAKRKPTLLLPLRSNPRAVVVPRPAVLMRSLAGLGVSARRLDSHIALGARFAMQQAVLPVRDGLIGENKWRGLVATPVANDQTTKTPEGAPPHKAGFSCALDIKVPRAPRVQKTELSVSGPCY